MCGIIAVKGYPTASTLGTIARLFKESQIRGRHATGVSYIYQDKIKSIVEPIPSKEFILKHFNTIVSDLQKQGMVALIGHTRYSTSGIEHNQPIYNQTLSVAMNGVVTQADPKYWSETFGYKFDTTNDTEIIHKLILNNKEPMLLETASMAVVGLWHHGGIFIFRNGQRPAYWAQDEACSFVASTKDIIKRSMNKSTLVYGIVPGRFNWLKDTGLDETGFVKEFEDLQEQQGDIWD